MISVVLVVLAKSTHSMLTWTVDANADDDDDDSGLVNSFNPIAGALPSAM